MTVLETIVLNLTNRWFKYQEAKAAKNAVNIKDVVNTVNHATPSWRQNEYIRLLGWIGLATSSGIIVVVLIYSIIKKRRRDALLEQRKNQMYRAQQETASLGDIPDLYDVCIVGAGPSGATCAYYLSKAGKRVLLLEKELFPRFKVCGNKLSAGAQNHLQQMGILQQLTKNLNHCKIGYYGGIVSPNGNSFVGEFSSSRVITVNRSLLDQMIVDTAVKEGATFKQNTLVTAVQFAENYWRVFGVPTRGSSSNKPTFVFYCRVLIAADGAKSLLSRALGVVDTPPESIGAVTTTRPYSHALQADHVRFFPARLLPGHIAMASEAEGVLNIAGFALNAVSVDGSTPNNETRDTTQLKAVMKQLLIENPHTAKSLGPNAILNPIKTAPMRTHTIDKSYGDHFLIIGEAAGQVDPFTGEGIQYGMDAAKIAADVLVDSFLLGDLSEDQLKQYQDQCSKKFQREFFFSHKLCKLIQTFPIILDAAVAVIKRRGQHFVSSWELVTTGAKSKLWLVRPDVGWMIALEAFSIYFWRLLSLLWKKKKSAATSQ